MFLQLITFQDINSSGQIDNIHTISTIDSEKSAIQNIDFDISSNNDFQDTCTNCKFYITIVLNLLIYQIFVLQIIK